MSFRFGDIHIPSKNFHSAYQVTDIFSIDLENIVISEVISANKRDMRYIIGHRIEPGKIIPLFIKTPKHCWSSGVSRYNDNASWRMSFNVEEDLTWIDQYKMIWDRIEVLLKQKLSGAPLNNKKYINPKLITWNGNIRTRFNGCYCVPFDQYCEATGVLKIGSVYQQGSNYYLQVFLKECKYREIDIDFQSQLSDDGSGYDTIA